MSPENQDEGPKKHYQTILEEHIQEGARELERGASGLLISSFAAGLEIGFGPLLLVVLMAHAEGQLPPVVTSLLTASAYSVGFMLVIFGRSELFTEHTTLAVLPVLDGREGVRELLRLWGLVYVANIAGAAAFSALATVVIPRLGDVRPATFAAVSDRLLHQPWWIMILSAVFAGWLMGLLSWLVSAGRDTTSQLVFVWLITGAIGLVGFHHSVAGAVEILMGVFVRAGPGIRDFLWFELLTVAGNAIGGPIFVALLKFGHGRRPAPEVP